MVPAEAIMAHGDVLGVGRNGLGVGGVGRNGLGPGHLHEDRGGSCAGGPASLEVGSSPTRKPEMAV